MKDTMLEDDEIIDLTDLLEEGQPPGEKTKAGESQDPISRINQPDSFDLGKEISMEYDISVEEIEHGDEALDIDVTLSSNETAALSEEKPGQEDVITLEDTGESLEAALDEDTLPGDSGRDHAPDEEHVISSDDTFTLSEKDLHGGEEFSAPEVESFSGRDGEPEQAETLSGTDVTFGSASAEEVRPESMPLEAAVSRPGTEELIEDIRRELPEVLEGIVRPLMAELIREIITASRDELPGIVEKVIREEIEKLKKLDS